MAAQHYSVTENTGFNAALKEFYLPRLTSTINEKRILMTRLERDSSKTDVSGRHARLPVNIRPSQAIGARSDGSSGPTLPTPQSQTFVELQIGYAFNYATVRITHPVIQASKNDRGAFVRAIGAEMDGIRRDLKNDINRQLFGDGDGVLGITSGTHSSGDTALILQAGHKVKVNSYIDSWTTRESGGSSTVDGVQVTAISGNTLTIAADTWADNAYIFRQDNRANEMMGLLGIVDANAAATTFTSTLQNIARATYPEWDAQVYVGSSAGTARAITEDILDAALLDSQSASEGETSLMVTSPVQFRKIGQLMTPDRRYSPSMELEGGFTAINWAGVPIVWDRDCPRWSQQVADGTDMDMIFGLDESELAIYQLADWDFDDTDGNVLHRRQDVAAYDATLFYYANLGTTDASKHFVIRDLER
jgi:hypothetical protein